jgi:hypothetical protein
MVSLAPLLPLPQTDAEHIWLALDLTTDAPDAWAGVGLSEQGGMKVGQG